VTFPSHFTKEETDPQSFHLLHFLIINLWHNISLIHFSHRHKLRTYRLPNSLAQPDIFIDSCHQLAAGLADRNVLYKHMKMLISHIRLVVWWHD